MFTLRNSDKWSLSRIGARFRKSKQWAAHALAAYSEESLIPNLVRKFGPKRTTDEVEDGVIVGMGKYLFKESYEKLAAALNDENICPDIRQNIGKWTVFKRCKDH